MFALQPPTPIDAAQVNPTLGKQLSQQTFNDTAPGPILRDFQVLLDRLGSEGIPITERSQLPSLKFLRELNESLTRPTRLNLTRPNQKHYPYAIGLFWVARTLGFALPNAKRKNTRFASQESLQNWASLSAEEQYFTLLAAWMHHANPEALGDRSPYAIEQCLDFFRQLQKKTQPLKVIDCDPRNATQRLDYRPALYNLALLDGFGLVDLETVDPASGRAWSIRSIGLTKFGEAILTVLKMMYSTKTLWQLHSVNDSRPEASPSSTIPFAPDSEEYQLLEQLESLMASQMEQVDNLEDFDGTALLSSMQAFLQNNPERQAAMQSLMLKAFEENQADLAAIRHRLAIDGESEQAVEFDLYYDSFRAFVPNLSATLVPTIPEFNPNFFVFKVSIGKVWRRLAIPGLWTLDAVASLILEAFEFGDIDHLYAFNFVNGSGCLVSIVHEYVEFGAAYSHEVRVGDLPIMPGMRIDFHFDFGDDWHFDLLLESIEPIDEATLKDPKALQIGSQGKPPKQYPDEEDW